MALWLTLLLVWTAGIPAGLFALAALASWLHVRRLERFAPFALSTGPLRAAGSTACGRRLHVARSLRTQAGELRRRA